MASLFSSFVLCEGDNCKEITDVTYYVKEKKLCKDCVSKEGCTVKASTGGQSLVCEEHDEKIKLYCKTHGVPLCNTWAMTHHDKCVLQDIAEAMEKIKVKLKGLKGKAKNKQRSCQAYGVKILQCRKESDAHLQAVKDEVDKTIQEAMDIDHNRERQDAAKINQEIDEKNEKLQEKIQPLQKEIDVMNYDIQENEKEIKKRREMNQKLQEKIHTLQEEIDVMKYDIVENNEERQKRLAMNHTNAEIRRQPLKEKQHNLLSDIQSIAEEIEKKIGELEKFLRNNTKATEDAIHKLDTVIEDDKSVVKDGHRVNTSVADELKKPLDEGEVTHVTQAVLGLRFVKGVGGKKYNGRIDGFEWEWKLIDTINVPDEIHFPVIAGCIGESNVIINDENSYASNTYMVDMNTKHTQRVITCSNKSWIISCALLNDDKIVCGKYLEDCIGDSLTGCISVYDRQWKLIKDITIPSKRSRDRSESSWVDVAADHDGMIIAVEGGHSKIYVINPADGKIIDTIMCTEKIRWLEGLSKDHIIPRPEPGDRRVLIIDRKGAQREIPISTRNPIKNVCVDPLTDDLYVTTRDSQRPKDCTIDQVMSERDMTKRVAAFTLSTRGPPPRTLWSRTEMKTSSMLMTVSGKMVACDENTILVFKKIFSL